LNTVINLQRISNSSFGIQFSRLLGRTLPPPAGRLVANRLAWLIASRQHSPQVQAVRANQWVVHDRTLDGPELDRAVLAVFRHGARCIYDMYHYYQDPAGLEKKVELSPRTLEVIERSRSRKTGAVLAGLHLSNFDLSMQALARHGLQTLVLSVPHPPSSYRLQNRQRTLYGMEALPFSVTALRRATERLKAGGTIMTGVERPIPSHKYPAHFFGQPAMLPVAHVQLALNTGVPAIVIACHMRPDGTYLVDASEEIRMRAMPDRMAEVTRNTEAILERLEALIREYPDQWLMYYPVWPAASGEMP
jgi:lauroyl/myristoyl acyltransferase